MAVHTMQFRPNSTEVFSSFRNLYSHYFFKPLTVAKGVNVGADTAHTFYDLDHLVIIADLSEFFQPSVNVSKCGNGLPYDLVFHDKLHVQRFRKNRMLRTERYDGTCYNLPYSCYRLGLIREDELFFSSHRLSVIAHGDDCYFIIKVQLTAEIECQTFEHESELVLKFVFNEQSRKVYAAA